MYFAVNENIGNICFLPPSVGTPICLAAFHNWYYNAGAKECKQFLYGGCGGNANNFPTRIECEERCAHEGEMTTTEFHLILE